MAADPCPVEQALNEGWQLSGKELGGNSRIVETLARYFRFPDSFNVRPEPVSLCVQFRQVDMHGPLTPMGEHAAVCGGRAVLEVARFEAPAVADTAFLHLPVVQMPVVRSLAG